MKIKELLFRIFAVILVGGVTLFIFWWGGRLAGSPTPLDDQMSTSEPVISGTEVREVDVVGNEYSFSPAEISVKSGEKVKINFKNGGRLPHNITIDELGFATATITGGKTTSAELTAAKTGTFSMYCSIGDHKTRGMEGELEVK